MMNKKRTAIAIIGSVLFMGMGLSGQGMAADDSLGVTQRSVEAILPMCALISKVPS